MTSVWNKWQGWKLIAAAGAAMALVGGLGGCRGDREDKPPRQFIPDMDDSPKFKPQTENPFYERTDEESGKTSRGRAMLQPPAGTVAFGRWDFDPTQPMPESQWGTAFARERRDLLAEDPALFKGKTADGKYVTMVPVAVTAELLKTGAEKFNIYCAACHGYQGNGLGMVGQRWSGPVPSFHDPKYYLGSSDPEGRGTDGFMYHIAMNGVPGPDGWPDREKDSPEVYRKKKAGLKMPGYRHALEAEEAWAVVAYIRALQEHVSPDQVPAEQRDKLLKERQALVGDATPAMATGPASNGGAR